MANSCGSDSPVPAEPSKVTINDALNDPRIRAIVDQHKAQFEKAGVSEVMILKQDYVWDRVIPDEKSDQFINGVRGRAVKDGLHLTRTVINPYGGNREASDAVIKSIVAEIKAAGLGFDELDQSAVMRCNNSQMGVHGIKRTFLPEGAVRQ